MKQTENRDKAPKITNQAVSLNEAAFNGNFREDYKKNIIKKTAKGLGTIAGHIAAEELWKKIAVGAIGSAIAAL